MESVLSELGLEEKDFFSLYYTDNEQRVYNLITFISNFSIGVYTCKYGRGHKNLSEFARRVE